MRRINLLMIVAVFVISGKLFAQDMTLPPPIDSPLLNSMTGSWVSEPYQMMGSTMTEEAEHKMVLNSQFMEVNIKSVSTSGSVYEAIVMIMPSKDGTITGWAFDSFGKTGITTYTGTWKDNMIYLYGTAPWGTESRVINVDGNVMIHNVIYKMKDDKGKDLPEQTIAITYNKK